jgi:hypothetical protein
VRFLYFYCQVKQPICDVGKSITNKKHTQQPDYLYSKITILQYLLKLARMAYPLQCFLQLHLRQKDSQRIIHDNSRPGINVFCKGQGGCHRNKCYVLYLQVKF